METFRSLETFFSPKSVAIIGATERPHSVGSALSCNLKNAPMKIYAINPKYSTVHGIACYPNVGAVKEPIDLAIIAIPAAKVPAVIDECVKAHIPSVIIISAGFKEASIDGLELEEQILLSARGHMRIIGPNCLGIMRPSSQLNVSFANGMLHSGSVAFLSQSGALCTTFLDQGELLRFGFSALVSVGSLIDVRWDELIDYFANDKETKAILIYMETLSHPDLFFAAAKKAAQKKPIIILKVGKQKATTHAIMSHSGSIIEDDEAFSASMKEANVLRIDTIEELFQIAHFLSKQPCPRGPNLTIVTNAGGPAIIATDALASAKGALTSFSLATESALDQLIPNQPSHNPIDLLGDATEERYAAALKIIQNEKASDGTLVILAPQEMTNPTKCAETLQKYHTPSKPILASWMGAESVQKGIQILTQAGIPVFPYPDQAARIFGLLSHLTEFKD